MCLPCPEYRYQSDSEVFIAWILAESDRACVNGCAISSSRGRFSRGGGANSEMQKSDDLFTRTQVFTITTTHTQNTLQHFRVEASALKTFFSKGAPVFVEGGRRAPVPRHNGTMAMQSKPAPTVVERSA